MLAETLKREMRKERREALKEGEMRGEKRLIIKEMLKSNIDIELIKKLYKTNRWGIREDKKWRLIYNK